MISWWKPKETEFGRLRRRVHLSKPLEVYVQTIGLFLTMNHFRIFSQNINTRHIDALPSLWPKQCKMQENKRIDLMTWVDFALAQWPNKRSAQLINKVVLSITKQLKNYFDFDFSLTQL